MHSVISTWMVQGATQNHPCVCVCVCVCGARDWTQDLAPALSYTHSPHSTVVIFFKPCCLQSHETHLAMIHAWHLMFHLVVLCTSDSCLQFCMFTKFKTPKMFQLGNYCLLMRRNWEGSCQATQSKKVKGGGLKDSCLVLFDNTPVGKGRYYQPTKSSAIVTISIKIDWQGEEGYVSFQTRVKDRSRSNYPKH
jgi:hypothetical protein